MKEVYTVYDETNAPAGSQSLLSQVRSQYGFIPNSLAEMAASPQTLQAYLNLGDLVSRTSLTENERMIVMLATSSANDCQYCVPAVSTMAKQHGLPEDVVARIRNGEMIDDTRWEALRSFTEKMVYKKGWESDNDIREFLSCGFTKRQMMEVVLIMSMKNIAIYCNHIINPELDAEFCDERWH